MRPGDKIGIIFIIILALLGLSLPFWDGNMHRMDSFSLKEEYDPFPK